MVVVVVVVVVGLVVVSGKFVVASEREKRFIQRKLQSHHDNVK